MEILLGSCGDFAIPIPPFPPFLGQIWFVRVDPRFALTFLLYLRLSALRCLDTHRRSPSPKKGFAFPSGRRTAANAICKDTTTHDTIRQ